MQIETKQNFISIDGKTARNSYGEYFTIEENVGHEGADNTATIISFIPSILDNEIKVITTEGHATLDFLVKL